MRKTIHISLSEELFSKVECLSKQRGMSMSSFISNVLSKSLTGKAPKTEVADPADSHCTVRLHGRAAATLKEKAAGLGLSPTVFVRDVLLNKEMTVVKVDDTLSDQLLDILVSCDSAIMCFIGSLDQSQSSEQVKFITSEINANLIHLKEAFDRYYSELLKSGRSLEAKTIRRLIDGNRKRHRNT